MVSSKFTHRRRSHGTPLVCIPSPPPPVILPPVPPPPYDPPECFDLDYVADWTEWDGPHHAEGTIELCKVDPPPWFWHGQVGDVCKYYYASWHIDEIAHTADITVERFEADFPWSVIALGVPVIWDEEHDYEIDEWDFSWPGDLEVTAEFTF